MTGVKYDTYLNLPVRQTASIFKQPVQCITNHKNDVPKIDSQTMQKFADKLKPVQVSNCLPFYGTLTDRPESVKRLNKRGLIHFE